MRIALSLSLVGFALLFTGYLVCMAPYHVYNLALNEGIDSSYLRLSKVEEALKKGGDYEWTRVEGVYAEEQKVWKKFHFFHFELPLPVHHPYYLVVPDLKANYEPPELGMKLLDQTKKFRASFYTKSNIDFVLSFKSNKLFNLPAFKNYILKKKESEIWEDLFKKDLTPGKFSITDPQVFDSSHYKELVYNLFILKMREKFLPDKAKKVSFFKSRSIGVIEVEEESDSVVKDNFRVEYLYILDEGIIRRIVLKTRNFDLITEAFRKRFFKQIKFKPTSPDDSIAIYNEYKNLTYKKRVDQEGMVYLFAAWTHNLENERFLREMVRFLERGEENLVQLQPLYDYAYRKYGTNYSNFDDRFKETAQKRLERKTAEELEKEREEERKRTLDIVDGEFQNDEEKIKFFLQKAKDEGKNLDEDEAVLRN